jgi:tripartite-type tricarboxylate transporter receptor subunit TctC
MDFRTLRRLPGAIALGAIVCLGATAHGQETYPSHAIRMIVPFAAGSAADVLSRTIAAQLATQLGQAIVVENKGGAGGTIGTTDIAKAAPDGYTIGMAAQGSLINNQVLYDKPGYDSVKDFSPIAVVADVQNVLVVNEKAPYKNVAEFLAAIKAKPDNAFSYSSSGAGTSHHIAGVVLGQYLKKPLMHVPYKGAPQGLVAIMAGEVNMGLYNIPAAIGQVQGGKLKPLAVTGLTRSSLMPDIPTLDESGLKGYEVTLWFGLIAPANMPAPLMNRLHSELDKVMANPAIRSRLTEQGYTVAPSPLAPSSDFTKLIQRELVKWPPILRESGATAN